ncbi:uncharacterized protein LOC113203666 [Frankliniella occidentalis]|uniref:Uncharacterized protein LOC113203666 n=1 Tax=Frankliniella occidentalis TaxID=133901 RepID=A0A6J1RZ99_FRAOC|nr:uncharacterized protein LOC113203666 [Frankliniella occidentalis]
MKGSVAVRRASGAPPPHLGPHMGLGLGPGHHHHHHHHFPPMAVDSLHHHHANNHNSHQHMARVKAGVARTTSSSSAASSSSILSSSSGGGGAHAKADARLTPSSVSSSGGGTGGRAAAGSERLTPRRFLEKYSLPRVVRVVAEQGSRQPLSGPLAQPLLLYRQYTSCKVLARSLRRDKHAASETGPPLVIPDSYQGWFSLVRERSLQTRAKVYTTIQQLVSARVAVFLSKGSLTGFKLAHSPSPGVDGDGGLSGRRLQYARSTVRGGQVLRLLAVFEDNEAGCSSARSRRGPGGPGGLGASGLGSRGSGLGRALPLSRMGGGQPTQYAQCLTARNESVFVPVSAAGSFYAVATDDVVDGDADHGEVDVDVDLSRVYQLPQLLRLTAEPLPVKVQLVCGPIQSPLPGGFSGLLVLEDLQQEDVILACTLPRSWAMPCAPSSTTNSTTASGDTPTSPSPTPTPIPTATNTTSSSSSSSSPPPEDSNAKPVFLEMDADSKFLLMRPLASREAEARFFKTPLLRRVLAHCRERADLWSSQIKVTHHVFPAVAGDTTTASTPTTPSPITPSVVASTTSGGSTRSPSENGSRAIHALFRVKEGSALSGKASSLSSGGTKKSQSFRYASPAMMGSSSGSSAGGGKPPSGASSAATSATNATGAAGRGTHRGTHHLLQQLQSLSGIKNLLRRSSSVSPQSPPPPDVPLSVVFPELFGLAAPSASEDGEVIAAGSANGVGPEAGVPGVTSIAVKHVAIPAVGVPPRQQQSSAPPQQQLRFYADELPYGRVADALPSALPTRPPVPRGPKSAVARGHTPLRRGRGRSLYDEAEEEEDDDEDEDDEEEEEEVRGVRRRSNKDHDDEENIYAEICECPRRRRGVVVSGARVILTTACSEERRGYYTFASATSKDQYYTGGSDGTFSGTMSSSNPSNPEEDIYDNVC